MLSIVGYFVNGARTRFEFLVTAALALGHLGFLQPQLVLGSQFLVVKRDLVLRH